MDTAQLENKMKSYSIQSLLDDRIKEIKIDENSIKLIKLWESMFENKVGKKPENIDYYIFGNSISNPILRQKFKSLLEKEIKYDDRITY